MHAHGGVGCSGQKVLIALDNVLQQEGHPQHFSIGKGPTFNVKTIKYSCCMYVCVCVRVLYKKDKQFQE